MANEILNRLIGKGYAKQGTWNIANAVSVLPRPAKSIVVITDIKWKHFVDLPAGKSFSDIADVYQNSWHQLKVWSEKGCSYLQFRNDLQLNNNVLLPVGESNVNDLFWSHNDNIRFEISRIEFKKLVVDPGQIPPGNDNWQKPPGDYGTDPTGIQTVKSLRETTFKWEYNPLGYDSLNVPGYSISKQFTMPIQAGFTALNPPQPTIAFGLYTLPSIIVKYVVIYKFEDLTVQGSL